MTSLTVSLPPKRGKKPVILQVLPELGVGGAEQGCVDMAYAIAQAGGKAIICSHGGTRNRLHELARAGATHIDLPVDSKNPWVMWANIKRLKSIINDYSVDIVHARSRAPAWSAMEACRRTGARFMTTCHAPYNTQNFVKKRYNSAIAEGERVIAISHYVAKYLRDTYSIGDDRLRIIPRGIAMEKFHPSTVTPDRMIAVANEWRIPDGAKVILLPGRLTRWKGQSVLIEAMAELDNKDVFAVLVGSDQGRDGYAAELHALIRSRGLEGRVRIVDHCDDMPAAYMLSHIVVSASTEPEGFGRVPVEGQAMGKVVIATDHGGAQETVIQGVTGFLIPPGDYEALAAALDRALAMEPQQRVAMCTTAMAHVARNFTRDQMMDETLMVYTELLNGRP